MTPDITHHIQRIDRAHERLDKVEGRLIQLETYTAVADERAKSITKSLEKIEAGQSWIIRLVLGSIVLAAIAFLVSGGMHVAG